MEDFDQFLMGGAKSKANPQANPVVAQGGQKPSSAWTDAELDRLINTESSKNPYAINKETKAMGVGQFTPDTLAMLHKQGIKFDPFDAEQSRVAIRTYLDKLTAQTGSKEGALKAYGGFVTKDPTGYINKILVSGEQPKTTAQPTDSFDSFLSGAKAPSKEPGTDNKPKTISEAGKQFGKEVMKPLSEMSWEGFKKESILAPAVEYTAASLGLPGFTEEDKKAAQDKLIAKGKGFVEGVKQVVTNPVETAKAVGTELLEHPGRFVGETIKGTIYDPELALIPAGAAKPAEKLISKAGEVISPAAKTLTEQFAKREPLMAGVGAAETQNATILRQAMETASPELKAQLEKLDPNKVNPEVLNRIVEADSLPVPLQYTKGQQLQDPVLISQELNARGKEAKLAEVFNQQNKILQENATVMKDRVAPDVFTESHVADSQGLIGNIEAKAKANADATNQAYKDLRDAGGGKFPIDGQQFANSAINLLKAEDRLDYLPAQYQRKLIDYQTGKKEMNFNLFENLRTDLADDIRKAQRAGDGREAYVLGQVRSELEKLPMIGETAEIKALADKARSLAKADFDLEKQNKIYSDVVNGKADTKNFISKNVINSTNKDFANTMALVADDPIAKQHLASGTLDLIIRDSTDASGNFLTGKFAKHINNLQLNGKLVPLFGEEAATLEKIANASKIVGARPKGSFVNESNTLVGAMAEYAKSAAEHGTNIAFKGLPVGTIARSALGKRAAKKQLEETLNPASGVQLKDIGKK